MYMRISFGSPNVSFEHADHRSVCALAYIDVVTGSVHSANRQAIHRGRVSYEPNSLDGGCPFQSGAAGFVSFPEPVDQDEMRGQPEKFAEHYNQATLFYEGQSATPIRRVSGRQPCRLRPGRLLVADRAGEGRTDAVGELQPTHSRHAWGRCCTMRGKPPL